MSTLMLQMLNAILTTILMIGISFLCVIPIYWMIEERRQTKPGRSWKR